MSESDSNHKSIDGSVDRRRKLTDAERAVLESDVPNKLEYVEGRLIRPHALTDAERAVWALAVENANTALLNTLHTVSELRDEKDEALSHVIVLLRLAMLKHDGQRCWCRPLTPNTATCAEGSFIRAAYGLLARRDLIDHL